MMRFDDRYFNGFKFTRGQTEKNLDNAMKDLAIAKQDKITEVKFTYAYSALIKAGIALANLYDKKVKSVPGHHAKIIEMISTMLGDGAIEVIGNAMRSKRNTDFYGGGSEVTNKEAAEYLEFVNGVVTRISKIAIGKQG